MSDIVSKILSFFGFGDDSLNTKSDFRRKHIRYPGFHAEVVIGSRAYSIRDWSLGGLTFDTGPDARLATGDKIPITLKFRFPHDTISIQQQAQVVRAVKRGIAAKFVVLPADVRRQFERVLDSLHVQSFLESQVA